MSRAELYKALAAFQGEVGAPKKGSTNPHFRSRYSDLADVWAAIRPPLSKHGLAVSQWPHGTSDGVGVLTVLTHVSGYEMMGTLEIPLKAGATAQQIGSAITYARRYALLAALGLAPDDDDGNSASEAPRKRRAAKPSQPPPKVMDPSPPFVQAAGEAYKEYVAAAKKTGTKAKPRGDFLKEANGGPWEGDAEALSMETWHACADLISAATRELGSDEELPF